MKIEPNDARLTALVLNELNDQERQEVEALLVASPEAQAAVEEIRALANALTTQLAQEPMIALTSTQRERLEAELSAAGVAADGRNIPFNDRAWQTPMAIAASIILAFGVAAWQLSTPDAAPTSKLVQVEEYSRRGLDALATRDGLKSGGPSTHELVDVLTPSDNDGDGVADTYPLYALGDGYLDYMARDDDPGDSDHLTYHCYADPSVDGVASASQDHTAGNKLESPPPNSSFADDDNGIGGSSPDYPLYVEAHASLVAESATDAQGTARTRPMWMLASDGDLQTGALVVTGPPSADAKVAGDGAKDLLYLKMMAHELPRSDMLKDKLGDVLVVASLNESLDSQSIDQLVHSLESVGMTQDVDDFNERLERIRAECLEDLQRMRQDAANEAYAPINENHFLPAMQNPLSTFSIDVDTASYANVRRFLNQNTLPPPDAVRIEELINYFTYDYPEPENVEHPFSVNIEVADCPWNPEHRLARIGLQGYEIPANERPASNLVFLLDVSGSMQPANKLPLVKQAMTMLINELDGSDRVAIVVYAGSSGLVLPSTTCNNKQTILNALNNLSAGGSTNGAAGIQLAYDVAAENFIEDGVNRVILATDGDFNVGITNRNDLTNLITERAAEGVHLSVLGFGMGNLKDATMEQLADKGNGNYAYIDNITEAEKVLVDQISGTLVTIAKDVKIQIEFNPAMVAAYRLIGYENRQLAARDFNDDTKDAGEIGAGHSVTALYEIVPAGVATHEGDGLEDVADVADVALDAEREDIAPINGGDDTNDRERIESEKPTPAVDPLKYQAPATAKIIPSNELMTIKLRFKPHDGDTSTRMDVPFTDTGMTLEEASGDFHFAASVATFGMLLRGSSYSGEATFDMAKDLAEAGLGPEDSYRLEYLDLVEKAASLKEHRDQK